MKRMAAARGGRYAAFVVACSVRRAWVFPLLLAAWPGGHAAAGTQPEFGDGDLAGAAARRVAQDPLDVVRPLPRKVLGPGGGCMHFLAPPDGRGERLDRAILDWPFSDETAGTDARDLASQPVMNIGGRVTPVIPETGRPEDSFKRPRKGARFTEVYRLGSLTFTFKNTITFVCPPKDESCEVTRFKGTLEVSDGGGARVYRTVGECGF